MFSYRKIVRELVYALLAVIIGGAGGFICAAIIVSSCSMFSTIYYHPHGERIDWNLKIDYIITASIIPGSFLGAVFLPVAYLSLFRNLPVWRLFLAGCWIGTGVLAGGLLLSPATEIPSLFGTLLGLLLV